MVNTKCPKEDIEKFEPILVRFEAKRPQYERMENFIDLCVCQAGACILDLDKLTEAGDEDFFHDLDGIKANLNRRTGVLENGFLPRFAIEEQFTTAS